LGGKDSLFLNISLKSKPAKEFSGIRLGDNLLDRRRHFGHDSQKTGTESGVRPALIRHADSGSHPKITGPSRPADLHGVCPQ
jgi:hypothetical protein